jgi:AraC-like DNA-binding protein/mannose-6-phosphate isomerase-like protein (cupin superfamily)
MNDSLYHEVVIMPQGDFPVKLFKRETNSHSLGCEFHWHKHIEFFYVEQGGLLLVCNGEKQWIYSNDIAVVNCYQPHRSLQFLDNTTHYCIQIDLDLLSSSSWDICREKYITPLTNLNCSFYSYIYNDLVIVNLLKAIINEYNNKTFGHELFIKSCFLNLFSLLFRNYYIDKNSNINPYQHNMELGPITRIVSYLNENFASKISLEELSRRTSLSIPYLCKIFKRYTGSTVIEYINQLRCQRALSLIAAGYSVTSAALSVGFNDSNYFSRIFRKTLGYSPSEAVRKTMSVDSGK